MWSEVWVCVHVNLCKIAFSPACWVLNCHGPDNIYESASGNLWPTSKLVENWLAFNGVCNFSSNVDAAQTKQKMEK